MRLTDDGATVTLDLHGVRTGDAEALIRTTVALARDRGRASVRVVHGASTSDPRARTRTIKHALHDLLDAGALPAVASDFRAEGHTLLSLGVGATPSDPRRLTLNDVW